MDNDQREEKEMDDRGDIYWICEEREGDDYQEGIWYRQEGKDRNL